MQVLLGERSVPLLTGITAAAAAAAAHPLTMMAKRCGAGSVIVLGALFLAVTPAWIFTYEPGAHAVPTLALHPVPSPHGPLGTLALHPVPSPH